MFGLPHRALSRESSAQQGITSDSSESRTSRIGSKPQHARSFLLLAVYRRNFADTSLVRIKQQLRRWARGRCLRSARCRGGNCNWLDVVVTGLFIIAIATPALLWLTWRRNADGARDDSHPSFRDWAAGEFDILTGPVKGGNATAEVLLPIAAVAVGMTVLGLVFHIIASGAA